MNEQMMQTLLGMFQQSMAKGGAQGMGGLSGGVGALNIAGMAIPALPLAEGGISLISGLMKQRQADKAKERLNAPDPRMTQFMSEIDRQRKSFETGSAYGQQMKELKNQQAATQEGIVRLAKGNTGSALQAMTQSGLATGMGYGKIAEEGQKRQDLYTQMYGDMTQRMEQRGYEQKMDEYNQANIDARDTKIKGLQTLMNTLALTKKIGGGQTSQDVNKLLEPSMGTPVNLPQQPYWNY